MQRPQEINDAPRGVLGSRILSIRDWIAATPAGGFVIVATTLLVATPLGTWTLISWFPALIAIEPLIESVLSIGVVLPLLVLLFVLPSARNIQQRQVLEQALRAEREQLVIRVRERTAELEGSNRRLRKEVDHRQRAQKAIEFQAGLLDAVEQAVVAIDREGRVRYWNRYAEDLYACRATEARGRHIADIVTFVRSDGRRLDDRGGGEGRSSWSGEVEAVRADGARLPVYLARSPLPGTGEGCVCVSFDITEWKAAREALRDSEEKYSSLVESSPTGIFIFQDEKLAFVNPRLSEILEYPRAELLELNPWHLLHAEDRERLGAVERKRAAAEPIPDEFECQLVTKSGQVRWVAMRNTLIRYRGGPAVLGNVQDITERRRMEMEVHRLSARLLKVQEEERRRLARDLHDSLGQKLTGIKFLIEASLGEPWPGERRAGVGRLRGLIPTIQDAVEEVRRISTELRPSILDDLGLVATMAWHLRELAKLHPEVAVDQQITAAESDVPVPLRTPIYRILQEATNNVAKHSGPCRMVVGLETGEGRLRLRVSDDGVGFDPGAPPRDGRNGGIGLGSMRERAEFSGGSFSVRSAPGAGTTIEAEWPLDGPFSG
jgi:PAS domain S-box-containing protein